MMLRIWSVLLLPCLLLGGRAAADEESAAAAAEAASAAPTSTPDFYLRQVQVQGMSTMPRERKTLAEIFKAQALFLQHRQLAPHATLTYRVYARQYADDLHRADLALLEGQTRSPIPLDDQQRFVADPAWRALDQDIEIRSKLADGRITWRPDIRTPGWPEAESRLGDLRLQCRVAFGSGLARTDSGWIRTLGKLFGSSEECDRADWSPSNFAERPIFSVTLVHGERRLRLNQRNLHGLFDDQGERYDWGFLLRDRMYRVPLGDRTWPDDTRVVFEYMDCPGAITHEKQNAGPLPSCFSSPSGGLARSDRSGGPHEGLQQSTHPFAAAARSLKPGISDAAEIQAAMGKTKVKILRFESGMQIWRYWQAGPKPTSAKVSLGQLAGMLAAAKAAMPADSGVALPSWDGSLLSLARLAGDLDAAKAALAEQAAKQEAAGTFSPEQLAPIIAAAKAAMPATEAKAAAAAPASPMWDERGTELVLLLNAEGRLLKLAFNERR
jgi:hypothetical protein